MGQIVNHDMSSTVAVISDILTWLKMCTECWVVFTNGELSRVNLFNKIL